MAIFHCHSCYRCVSEKDKGKFLALDTPVAVVVCACKHQMMLIANKGQLFTLFFFLLEEPHRFQHALQCKTFKLYLNSYPLNAIRCSCASRLKLQEQIVLMNYLDKAYSLGNAKSLVGECKMENHGRWFQKGVQFPGTCDV